MHQALYKVPPDFARKARFKHADYEHLYAESIEDPQRFWSDVGRRIDWIKPFSRVKDSSFSDADFRIRWFYDGTLNVSANCLDRHLQARGDKTAILWEGDDPAKSERISYRDLHGRVCRCANALKELGVKKCDRVTIYLPMIPEIAVAMLACTRLGATHSVVFAGFSSEALAGRIAGAEKRNVAYARSFADAVATVGALAQPGDMVLTLGAGSVSQMGAMLLEKLGTERPSQS